MCIKELLSKEKTYHLKSLIILIERTNILISVQLGKSIFKKAHFSTILELSKIEINKRSKKW